MIEVGGSSADRWRREAYRSAERLLAAAGGALFVSHLALRGKVELGGQLPALVTLAVVAIAPALRRLETRQRLTLVAVTLQLGSFASASRLGMTPGAFAGPFTAAVLVAMFGTRRAAVGHLALGAAGLVLVGAAMAAGWLSPPTSATTTPFLFVNWLRAAITMVVLGLTLSLGARNALAIAATARDESLRSLSTLRAAEAAREGAEGLALRAHKLGTVGQLAGAVGGELGDLFEVVLDCVDVIGAGAIGRAEARGAIARIQQAAQRASNLSRQLLGLGRLEEAPRRPVPLDEAAASALRLTRQLLPGGIELRTRFGCSGSVVLPAGQIDQVLVNLALNARDALGEKGTLTIETATEPGALPHVIRVADTGPGMAPATLARLFEPFFTTKGEGSAGLGLASTRRIVEQAGGRVDVASAPGRGTTVTLRFPEASASPAPGANVGREAAPLTRSAAPALPREQVYIVAERLVAAAAAFNLVVTVARWPVDGASPAMWVFIAFIGAFLAMPFLRVVPPLLRARALLVTGTALHLFLALSFHVISPAVVLAPVTHAVLAAVILGGRWPFALLSVSAAGVLLAGAIHPTGPLLATTAFDASQFLNWARTTVTILSGAAASVVAVASVITLVVRAMDDADRALRELEASVAARARAERVTLRAEGLEAVGTVSSVIAHELNNLLVVVINWADLLGDESAPDLDEASRRDALDDIRTASSHVANLARQLLAFGRGSGEAEIVPLDDAVTSAARLLRKLVPLPVRTDVRTGSGSSVRVGAGQIDQVLINLALNARDAMPAGGTLTIETGHEPRATLPLFLRVRDTGSGMDEATRARIFDRFFTTKGERGTGLGLAVVREIVEKADGAIQVESELGKGTTFTLRFPLAPAG